MSLSSRLEQQFRERQLRVLGEQHFLDHRLRRRELALKLADSKRTRWTPLAVAGITALAGLVGSGLVFLQSNAKQRLATNEFCYKVISETLARNRNDRGQYATELFELINALSLRETCGGNLYLTADLFSSGLRPAMPASSPGPGPASAPSSASAPASAMAAVSGGGKCERVELLQRLGWTAGHKTKFCQARGFDSVYNPFGTYSAGGYCYKGDVSACTPLMR